MGVSTDGILGYGYYFDPTEDYELTEKVCNGLWVEAGYAPGYKDEDDGIDACLDTADDKLKAKGIILTRCCHHEEWHWLITCTEPYSASRGSFTDVDLLLMATVEKRDFPKLENLITNLGLDRNKIGWKLTSVWS